MLAMVGLMLVSFFITLVLAKPDVFSLVKGLSPNFTPRV